MLVKSVPQLRGTGSLGKALKLVTELAAAGDGGFRLTELVGRTNLDTSTVYRLLTCLVDEEFVQRTEGKRYRLGRRVYELGLAASRYVEQPAVTRDHMQRLVERVGTTVVLNVRSGAEAVYLERLEGVEKVSGVSPIGTRLPIGVGSGGLALLAAMAPGEAEALMRANERRYQAFGRHTSAVLRRRLAETRWRGYAKTVSLVRPDMRSLGIVLPSAEKAPRFAVSVVFNASRGAHVEDLLTEIRDTAQSMASAMDADQAHLI